MSWTPQRVHLFPALLRRDDPAEGVPPGQQDAAMIHLGCWPRVGGFVVQLGALHQSASAGRAPVVFHLRCHYRMALSASPFHTHTLPHTEQQPLN